MKLTELQLYINNIARCIGIVDLLSAGRQDHQCYTLTKCVTLLKIQLSTNYNCVHRYSVIILIPYQSTIPTKQLVLIISHYTNTRSWSTKNINISIEATNIPAPPSPLVSKNYFDNTLQEMFAVSGEIFNKYDLRFEKHQEELKQLREKYEETKNTGNGLVNLKSETLHLSEDTRFPKEKTTKF